MLRKVSLAAVPESIKSLVRTEEPTYVVIGSEIYEMAQTSFKEFNNIRSIVVPALVEAAKNGPLNLDTAADALIKAGVLSHILKSLDGIDEKQAGEITILQMLHLVTTWLHMNFFSLPEESFGNLMQMLGFFTNMLQSTRGSAAPIEMIPPADQTEEKKKFSPISDSEEIKAD